MDAQHDLTPEQASRMAVTAVAADLEYWARTVSVDGRVGLNDLMRTLDLIREASAPAPDLPGATGGASWHESSARGPR